MGINTLMKTLTFFQYIYIYIYISVDALQRFVNMQTEISVSNISFEA